MQPRHEAPTAAAQDPLAAMFSTSYAGIVAFVAVATEGSFARAGDRLGIGRSAVSRSVRKLEDQLDARLFLRTTRHTTLTREGERFYDSCQPGIQRILQALEDMRDLRKGPPRGPLRISAAPAFGRRVVMPLLEGFCARYPGISIEMCLHRRTADLATDRIDVAFRDGRMQDSDTVAKLLVPMQSIACASPGYARAHGLPSGVDGIAEHRCIAFRTGSGRIAEWEFKVEGRPLRLAPEPHATFDDLDLVREATLEGQGIAQLPGFLVGEDLREGRLVACLAHVAPDDGGHYLCYLSRQHLPARIRVFVDYMTERIRALDDPYFDAIAPARIDALPPAADDRVRRSRRSHLAGAASGGIAA